MPLKRYRIAFVVELGKSPNTRRVRSYKTVQAHNEEEARQKARELAREHFTKEARERLQISVI